MKTFIFYNKNLIKLSREMRNNPTASEKRFWHEVLRNKNFYDYKFLRQKVLLNYIVDFYCSKLLLVIEIDGETHLHTEEYDKKREDELAEYGIKIIRYNNDDIFNALDGVCDDLSEKIANRCRELGLA